MVIFNSYFDMTRGHPTSSNIILGQHGGAILGVVCRVLHRRTSGICCLWWLCDVQRTGNLSSECSFPRTNEIYQNWVKLNPKWTGRALHAIRKQSSSMHDDDKTVHLVCVLLGVWMWMCVHVCVWGVAQTTVRCQHLKDKKSYVYRFIPGAGSEWVTLNWMVNLFSVAKAVRRVVPTLLRGWTENVKVLQSLSPHLGNDGACSVSHVANNNWRLYLQEKGCSSTW